MPQGFSGSDLWGRQRYRDDLVGQAADGNWYSHSLSGNERNRLFLRTGEGFTDISLVSGADDLADGRSWCRVDYDGDGFTDIALMSLSEPRFKLYHNNIRSLAPDTAPPLRLRLRGTVSNRDAVGTRILATHKSGTTVLHHRQCGEGFASQNSALLSILSPAGDPVERLDLHWPSGARSTVETPAPGTVIEATEPAP